ncbi:porin [Bordetella holmesii]|uniref:porin n=1 Tax=Bordetella holmesii TaxID=35814 RepID=UPI0012987B1E|nr:porin [Bordetella holmesii]QGE13968.1 porin [Bordetella holmesii]
MKFTIRNAAALSCLPLMSLMHVAQSVSATSVQLYGLIDVGVQPLTHGPNGASKTGMSSGNLNGSRWGMRGSEDLGGGTKAVFTLESGFDPANGQSLQGSRLFGRQAYVGLSDRSLGTLTLGRHNTLMIDWMSKYNPFENANYGGKRIDAAFSDRMDNSIKYINTFGGLSVGAYYSFGWHNDQSWTDTNTGRMIGAGLRYQTGGLDAAVLYHTKRADAPKAGADSSNREDRILGALSYDFGLIKLYGGYRWLEQKLVQRDYVSRLYWAGARYQAAPATNLSLAIYHMQGTTCDNMNVASCPTAQGAGSDQKPTLLVLGAEYDLSKRTTVYALSSYALNDNGSSVSVIGGKYGVNVQPGSNQLGVALGMRHRF